MPSAAPEGRQSWCKLSFKQINLGQHVLSQDPDRFMETFPSIHPCFGA